jgi:hypothetical protein
MSELQEQLMDTPDLKPERVAEGLAAPWPAAGEPVLPPAPAVPPCEASPAEVVQWLRPERVQDRLKKMPGWSLGSAGRAVQRERELATPEKAADYAVFVLREAARAQQKVRVGLEGARVVISVMAPSHGHLRNTIGLQQLDFAAALV